MREFRGSAEEIERQWYEQVYRGRGDRLPQLTWRAVAMGSVLGGLLSLTNLYIGLKAGWGFGVAITASILSYAIWSVVHRLGLARTPMTILENNCMQSTASAAGYSTGGTLISAFAAYMLINDQALSLPVMLAWIFFLSVLGVTMAIPMKRQMINIEQLRFPSGIAAAETLEVSAVVGGAYLPGGLGLDREREPYGGAARDVAERARARAAADRLLELVERAQMGGQHLQPGLGQRDLRRVLHRPARWRLAEPARQILARVLGPTRERLGPVVAPTPPMA